MTLTGKAPRWRTLLAEALIAAGLGLAFLAAMTWQQLDTMAELSADWPALSENLRLKLSGTPLGTAVYTFVGIQLALHVAFGLVCWGLAVCTGMAYPRWRHRRITLLFAWFGLVVGWLLVGNATGFPLSRSGIQSGIFAEPLIGRARPFELLTLVLMLAVGLVVIRAALEVPRLRAQLPRIALFGTLVGVSLTTFHWWRVAQLQTGETLSGRPNIILIGIDSLRRDAIGSGRGLGLTPNIDGFLRDGAHRFDDAITPLARTFPSWTSILSGRYPSATGARENLMSFARLKEFDTLGKIARRAGYRTVFATDEVRFSNIDASYGFDQVITPTIGAADFLLGKANDLPLPNMISNTWLGKWLFPATYGNRAAAHTYRPSTFVSWLDSEVQPADSTLFAVHLALPHNPYNWADSDNLVFDRVTDRTYQYASAVIAADAQFGAILRMLERKGMLRNAVVVFLSDHGEALGIPETDTLLRGETARQMMDGEKISLWGHGTSVLSPHQFAALLAIRGYGNAELPQSGRNHGEPVSLVDIAPTLADLAGWQVSIPFDGWSLRPLMMSEPAATARFAARPRFTETGFRTRLIMLGDFDERNVLGEAASFFVMNPANGRFEIRNELMTRLIEDKERAALSRNWLLAAIPADDPKQQQQKYVLVSRRGGSPQRLETPPSAQAEPEIRELWQALAEHYGDEMRPPARRVAQPIQATNQ